MAVLRRVLPYLGRSGPYQADSLLLLCLTVLRSERAGSNTVRSTRTQLTHAGSRQGAHAGTHREAVDLTGGPRRPQPSDGWWWP